MFVVGLHLASHCTFDLRCVPRYINHDAQRMGARRSDDRLPISWMTAGLAPCPAANRLIQEFHHVGVSRSGFGSRFFVYFPQNSARLGC